MTTNHDELLQHFFAAEMRRTGLLRKLSGFIIGILLLSNILFAFGYFNLPTNAFVNALAIFCLYGTALHHRKLRTSLQRRLSALLGQIHLDWAELNALGLTPEQEELIFTALTKNFTAHSNIHIEMKRGRGRDEKGPSFADSGEHFAQAAQLSDPAEHDQDYVDLEGPLAQGEILVEEANKAYAVRAKQRWELAERQDMDLIEAGVSTLGDLVASGWFENNAKDGAFAELMESTSKE